MLNDADSSLGQIEEQLFNLVKRALDEYEEATEGTPIPLTLITAYDKCHASIMKRIAKGSNMDMAQIMKNPRAWLIQNDRMRNQVLKIIEQQELGKLKVVGG